MTEHAETDWETLRPKLIKLALELGPLLVFFIVNARAGIYVGTAWFMGAMTLSLILSWVLLKKIAVMPLVTGVVVLVFGGLTLWLHDDTFIKLKPTIVNSLFAIVLLGGLVFDRSLLKFTFGDIYSISAKGWSKLTLNWGLFFLGMAVLNEVVWRGSAAYFAPDAKAATDFWVAFKVWGNMPIIVLFSMSQVPLLNKYALPATPEGAEKS